MHVLKLALYYYDRFGKIVGDKGGGGVGVIPKKKRLLTL
jgi:hypothetical protein